MKNRAGSISSSILCLLVLNFLVFFALPAFLNSSSATLAKTVQDNDGPVKIKMFVLEQASDLKNYDAYNKRITAWLEKERPEIISTDSNMLATGTGGWTIVKWIYYK